jgi:hypothetical protein
MKRETGTGKTKKERKIMRRDRFRSFAAAALALLLLTAASAFAATTGTLFGTVTDADGSALIICSIDSSRLTSIT